MTMGGADRYPTNKPPASDGKGGLDKLLQAILGGDTGPVPGWAARKPQDMGELLRQLSGNAGQMAMPGGQVGAVRIPAFGAGGSPQMGTGGATYGRQPGLGEATFFQTSMKGGMTPISAVSPLGVPQGWAPYAGMGKKKDDGKKGGNGPGNGNGNGNGNGGYIPIRGHGMGRGQDIGGNTMNRIGVFVKGGQ